MTEHLENTSFGLIRFHTEEECISALFQAKWPDGFSCPRCGHSDAYLISTRRLPLYECRACRAQTSLIAGTIMEGSRTRLLLWFLAIRLLSETPEINALELSRIIRVTYKTAWLIYHKIRFAMSFQNSGELLAGRAHVADYLLYKRLVPSLKLNCQEQPLLIGGSENEQGDIIRINMELQAKEPLHSRFASPATAAFIHKYIDPEVAKNTKVSRRFGADRNTALNRIGMETEWWLSRTFRGIGPKHLQCYLDQYSYHWNRRWSLSLFGELLRVCTASPVLTYPELTKRNAQRSLNFAGFFPRETEIAS